MEDQGQDLNRLACLVAACLYVVKLIGDEDRDNNRAWIRERNNLLRRASSGRGKVVRGLAVTQAMATSDREVVLDKSDRNYGALGDERAKGEGRRSMRQMAEGIQLLYYIGDMHSEARTE